MATIIIPSKNIYDDNNQKIRDNYINIIDGSSTTIEEKSEENGVVDEKTYLQKDTEKVYSYPNESEYNIERNETTVNNTTIEGYAYIKSRGILWELPEIIINRLKNNALATDITGIEVEVYGTYNYAKLKKEYVQLSPGDNRDKIANIDDFDVEDSLPTEKVLTKDGLFIPKQYIFILSTSFFIHT